VLHQQGTQLGSVDFAFAQTEEKGFEVGALGMRARTACVAASILLVNGAPIEQGKEGPIVLHDRVGFAQASKSVLVKRLRIWYHKDKLLHRRVV
jgi:hypothetical protein